MLLNRTAYSHVVLRKYDNKTKFFLRTVQQFLMAGHDVFKSFELFESIKMMN